METWAELVKARDVETCLRKRTQYLIAMLNRTGSRSLSASLGEGERVGVRWWESGL
jgi:hypothetical protein